MRHSFPNGFQSWHETHFNIVDFMLDASTTKGNRLHGVRNEFGYQSLVDEAVNWTDEFEKTYKGTKWNEFKKGSDTETWDFYEVIEDFCQAKLLTF